MLVDRIRRALSRSSAGSSRPSESQAQRAGYGALALSDERASLHYDDNEHHHITTTPEHVPFTWLDYSIFVLLGASMLWFW